VDRYKITFGNKTVFQLFIYRVTAGRITGMWEFRADSGTVTRKVGAGWSATEPQPSPRHLYSVGNRRCQIFSTS
jgi:hypothetical protein